jgi:hypothetical protein
VPMLAEVFGSRVGELADRMAAVYGHTFTVDEMRQITAFCRTSVGQKFLEQTPAVFQQTTAVGQAFGLALSQPKLRPHPHEQPPDQGQVLLRSVRLRGACGRCWCKRKSGRILPEEPRKRIRKRVGKRKPLEIEHTA